MEVFKLDVLILFLVLIVIAFTVSTYKMMKSRLLRIPGSISGGGRNVQPIRIGDEQEHNREHAVGRVKYWFRELFSCYKIYGELFRRLPQRGTLLSGVGDLIVMAAVSVGMALFCTYSDGGADLYMTTFMTLMYVSAVLILFARCVNGARAVYLPCCILILTGIALAVLLYLSPMQAVEKNYISHPQQSVNFHIIAVLFGLAVFPLIRMVCRAERRTEVLILLNVLIVLIYLLLCVMGEEINGAKNWIRIGTFQFQVTEVTKVLTMAVLGLTLTNEQMTENWRFWCSVFTMALNGLFLLLVCKEFGTLMVLCVVFLAMCLIYQKDTKKLIAIIAAAALFLSAFLVVAKSCYEIKNPKTTPSTTEAAETTAPTETAPAATGEAAPEEETISWTDKLVDELGGAYKKVQDRFLVFLMPDQVDLAREGYQWKMSREALVISDWFGSPYDISVPVARSDFIYIYMIVRLGVVFGFVVLLMLLVMLCAGMLRCMRNPQTGEAAVSLSFLIAMVFQSVLAAASATGNFAIVGLPFVFLAYGGSAMLVNYAMLIFLIYSTGTRPLTDSGKNKRKVISRREE